MHPRITRRTVVTVSLAVWSLLVAACAFVLARHELPRVGPQPNRVATLRADFGNQPASAEAREAASLAMVQGDNRGLPFLIVDKRNARLYVFDAAGSLRGNSSVLLGLAHGDDSAPGIGTRTLAQIRPEERTTPAGRFVAEPGRNAQGEEIVWVDYDAAVSMHRVRTLNPAEHRLQRLASTSLEDKRISYGCINVPADFYDAFVSPALHGKGKAVVYVLPETRPVRTIFTTEAAAAH
jgi:hypothetical protein